MHELPITESILNVVLKHARLNNARKVVTVRLQVGGLSDLQDEWLQRYFDYLSRKTVAEGAKLEIERTPIKVRCSICPVSYEIQAHQLGNLICPACGAQQGTLVSGRDYHIKTMEVL